MAASLQLRACTARPTRRALIQCRDGLQLPEHTARANGTALRWGEVDYNSQHTSRGEPKVTHSVYGNDYNSQHAPRSY